MRLKPEEIIQLACVDFTVKCCPEVLLSASQNGIYIGDGKNVYAYMQKQKRLGLLSGELDIMLTWPGRNILFIEMKSKDGRLTENQREVISLRIMQVFPCEVARSLDEYINLLVKYNVLMRTKINLSV